MVLLFTLFFVVIFSGAVSAASLNLTDAESASTAVKNYTATNGHIPGSVVVSDKNSTSASFLNTLSTYIVELNNSESSTVTIAKVNNATGPSGTGTGTLQLSEYVTVANNVKNFISTNGRVPNYSSSSLGNIRYESLVYAFSKILDFYAANGRLPNTASVTNIAGVDSTSVIVSNSLFSDVNTSKTFSSVQSAINDPTTLSGHVIQAQSGTYTENVIVNKNVTIKPVSGGIVSFEAVNPFSPVFNITTSGASIQGLSICNAFNSTGINLNGVSGCNITFNNLFNNYIATGVINSKNSYILNNTMHDALRYGIFLSNSNSTLISGNSITGGLYCINPQNSNATIQFNRFDNCSQFALVVQYNSNITATNNWWGTNSPTYISSANWVSTYYDIYNYGTNTITYNPWIVLKSSANPTSTTGYSTLTADLTHNSSGGDTSSSGHIPDNLPVNFTTNGIGTVISSSYTRNGKATTTFNRNTATSGTAVVTSTLDGQSVTTNVTVAPVTDINTGKIFSTIQAAINDPTTLSGHVIQLESGTYNEKIIVNKTITLKPVDDGNVILQSSNYSGNIITINSQGHNSIIQGLQIIGGAYAIYLNGTSSCSIIGNILQNNVEGIRLENSNNVTIQNNILNNNTNGIDLSTSLNNIITGNNATNNLFTGIYLQTNSTYNLIQNNSVIGNGDGVDIYRGSNNNTITGNNIINNQYNGIFIDTLSCTVNFNRIVDNGIYGLRVDDDGSVIATNNWWGSNSPVVSSNNGSDIYINSGTVIYNPWIVLTVTANPSSTSGNSTVTADLTHNSSGGDTSSSGHIPDNIPVNFTTNIGTIVGSSYTRNGKATTTFNRGTATPGTAIVTSAIDIQSATTNITITNPDTTAPVVSASPVGGTFNSTKSVTLTASDNVDPNPVIYYTTDGSTPTTSSMVYSGPISISSTTTLKFMAVDNAGNVGTVQTAIYTIDTTAPVVSASPVGGTYNTNKSVTLTASDNVDPNPVIYYTTDGSTPTTSSMVYTGPISISSTTTLKFMAVDNAGNVGTVQTAIYTIDTTAPVVSASPVGGTYNTNKSVTLTASDNLDPNPVIYYTLNGSTPTTSSMVYSGPISISSTTTLKFMAVDNAGNVGTVQTAIYTIDTTAPVVSVSPVGGTYNTTKSVTLTATDNLDPNPVIYYTTDGSTPTTSSMVYSGPISISSTTTLKFMAVDNAGNVGTVQTAIYTIDTTAPVVSVSPVGGTYNTTKSVTLTATDNLDPNPVIYYTTDGSTPTTSSMVYTGPISISSTTTLKFMAVDNAGNKGSIYTQNYTVDTLKVTSSLLGGVYNTTKSVTLTATDNLDPNPVIYYTTDGSTPTTSSAVYSGPITIQMNGTIYTVVNLKYMAIDVIGYQTPIQNQTYTLTLPVVNINTNRSYSTIQSAINDTLTLNGNVIEIYSGIYTENVIVNKNLTINPFLSNNVTVTAANLSLPVFTINSSGSGSKIQKLTINGNISLYANNCTIYENTIKGNGTSGIIASNSFNNTISNNTITCNGFNGINSSSSSNTIFDNTIYGCESGIYSEYSSDNIITNNLFNNHYGIWTYNSTDIIKFNRITQNIHGLRNDIGTVNAINNWWGSNTDPSTNSSSIMCVSGSVSSNPWLVLGVNVSSTNSGGNSSVTADLTHNNQGGDTSSKGHVPDGIPINYNTTFGTIISTAYTVRGKASTILKLGSTQNATVNATASVDNQTVSTTGLITTGVAVLNITSTALDSSTGLPLNISYNITLNKSVTWLSVITIPTGGYNYNPADELRVILDGNIVLDKIIYTDNDAAIDTLLVTLAYPGVSGFNITVDDPNGTNVTNLNFPGNVVQRTNQLTYLCSPYDSLQSFSIATTDITTDIAQYWLNQSSNYQSSVMNAAYNAFLSSLMVEYIHDQIADNITGQCNVTWSRTSPIVVSVSEDSTGIYLTLDCDHSMGMTVVGTPSEMYVFNYITSSYIPFIEDAIMNNGTFSSVVTNLINDYLNNSTSVETIIQDGFIIEKSGDNFIVVDPETGICRDINTARNLCGLWSDWQYIRWVLEHGTYQLGVILLPYAQDLNSFDQWFNGNSNIRRLYTLGLGIFQTYDGIQFIASGSLIAGASIMGEPEDNAFGIVGVIAGTGMIGFGYYDLCEGSTHLTEAWNDP